jgi:hypothetical protein
LAISSACSNKDELRSKRGSSEEMSTGKANELIEMFFYEIKIKLSSKVNFAIRAHACLHTFLFICLFQSRISSSPLLFVLLVSLLIQIRVSKIHIAFG